MPTPLRDKAALLRRQHILEAAIRVFAERGFERATIRDVANAAGVSDGTIYNSFENKNALLLGIFDPLGEGAALADSAGGPPPADLETFLRALTAERWATFTPEMLAMLRVVLSQVLIDPALRALFFARVIAPALTGLAPPLDALAAVGAIDGSDLPMTLRLVTASFLGLVMLRLVGDEELEARQGDVPVALAALLRSGLPKKGGGDAGA